MSLSLAQELAALPTEERSAIIDDLSVADAALLEHDWAFWARPEQLAPPGNWHLWLILAGRGYGKTRTGAEWLSAKARIPGLRLAIVAETGADARDVMVGGDSGILACATPGHRPTYEPSKRRLTWPNGTIATTYSGEEPDQLRGPAHAFAWADEPAKWRYLDEAWDNLELGLRLGESPQMVATTTPRPLPRIKEWLADPMTVITRGTTYENMPNLAPAFADRIKQRYEGTRLGRQEIYAEILEDLEGALWNRGIIQYKGID